MAIATDIQILRDLARQYAEIAADPIQDAKRDLWRKHNSLRPTRTPILATYGMWNVWCREVFGDQAMQCVDPFYRQHERWLRMQLFQYAVGDDSIQEPWITQGATEQASWRHIWGVNEGHTAPQNEGDAWQFDPPIMEWSDMAKLSVPRHIIDEEDTARNVARLQEAVGDILEVNVERGGFFHGFVTDISTSIAGLRGLEQLMVDMYESPDELHKLLAFMRDGILAVQDEVEGTGDQGLISGQNQTLCYSEELEAPKANTRPRTRKDLWGFCAAQEYTLVSPTMHDEFLVRYQLPIMEKYGLMAYGCCEDLTNKIDMLRQFRNLRIIAVTPRANVARCAEQIGTDYVMSWRPNPTDMVCCGFDEGKIRRIIGEGMDAAKGCYTHIHLKDVETVEGEPERLKNWVRIVRDVVDA
jgi:hypothetical protein